MIKDIFTSENVDHAFYVYAKMKISVYIRFCNNH